jgi:hypothetical protein
MNEGKQKKKPGRKKTGQRITSGSISKSLLRKVRKIAAHRGISNAAVLDRYATHGIDREFRRVVEEDGREFGEAGC